MKRSQVNEIMEQANEMIRSFGFTRPPVAYWSPEKFKRNATGARPIIDAQYGWDITDYGASDFGALGLLLFTLNNGRLADLQHGSGMCYAEKLLISRQDQLSSMHTHVIKAEDQGGTVYCDGLHHDFAPGEKLRLASSESVTLMPGDWHAFWGGGGDLLIGEISTVNDDNTGNIFNKP